MAKKYYAVARGKTPGIYFTWEDCKAQVEHFPGPVYKGFSNLAEAEEFIKNAGVKQTRQKAKNVEEVKEQPVSTDTHLVAYVDGSYDHRQLRYAYGCVLVLPDEVVTLKGSGAEEDYVAMRNVAGEILGSEQAVLWALEHGYQEVTVYYDYEGVERWADGSWRANKPGTQRYKAFIAEKREKIAISFHKVAAHTGVEYNELADQLAKEALGIEKEK